MPLFRISCLWCPSHFWYDLLGKYETIGQELWLIAEFLNEHLPISNVAPFHSSVFLIQRTYSGQGNRWQEAWMYSLMGHCLKNSSQWMFPKSWSHDFFLPWILGANFQPSMFAVCLFILILSSNLSFCQVIFLIFSIVVILVLVGPYLLCGWEEQKMCILV